ncbi:MAG: hypothetical protein ACR2KS_10335 [Candidatus Eremiobacter antarcticus]|nr:hypothetical protein [Candidatus Eremiobacteraeota bacterium]MBC5808831.1 hypothetical protein [Candidatus Eremiobacteraeota bacterium]
MRYAFALLAALILAAQPAFATITPIQPGRVGEAPSWTPQRIALEQSYIAAHTYTTADGVTYSRNSLGMQGWLAWQNGREVISASPLVGVRQNQIQSPDCIAINQQIRIDQIHLAEATLLMAAEMGGMLIVIMTPPGVLAAAVAGTFMAGAYAGFVAASAEIGRDRQIQANAGC